MALGIFILVVMQVSDTACNTAWKASSRRRVNTFGWKGANPIAYRGNQSNRPVRLTNADLPGIASQADTIPAFSRRIRLWGAEIVWENPEGENKGGSFGVRGVDPAHIELERSVLLSGRYINERDVRDSRKVAVVVPTSCETSLEK